MSSFKLKVLLIGAAAAGVEDLINRIVKNRFQANYRLTVGVDILTKDVEFRKGEIATLSIWNLGRQNRFEFIRSTFYKGAAGALLVFDLTRKQTYTEIRDYLTEIQEITGKGINILLIGNLANLKKLPNIDIDRNEVRKFILDEGGIYIEAAPSTFSIIEDALRELTIRIIRSRSSKSS
jgi:Ras-related protein Rab-11A